MPKKKNWFDRVKQFFGADTKSKQEKRERRKRWLLGRLKLKFSPALPAPSKPTTKSLRDVEEEQSKYAMAVAVATAVAAEAAVAAAQAAAHVVRLTGAPLSHHKRRDIAAVRIQNAFRGYLARKALGALKGLVRLQALIRGQAVRRQTTMTLRSLRSVMKIQSEVRASRARFPVDYPAFEDKDIVQAKIKKSGERRASENPALWQLQQYSGRDWDSSTLSKEEINTMLKSRLMAALKRERAMEYASARQERRNMQRPSTPIAKETDALNQRWSWLDRWVGAQPSEKDIYENVPVPSPEHNLPEPLLLLDPIHNKKDEESQLRYLARRSFNRSRHSQLRDDESFTSSPFFPGYMASTVSAKARFRSMSTPKQRLEFNDACSDHCTSSAIGLLSPFTSAVSEAGACKTQKSSSRWAPAGPVKSRRSAKNLSFDSECSLVNWDRHNAIIH